MAEMLKHRDMEKYYLCIVKGKLEKTVAFRGAEFDYQGIDYPQSSIASRI